MHEISYKYFRKHMSENTRQIFYKVLAKSANAYSSETQPRERAGKVKKKKERRSLKDTQDSILKYKRDEDT